MRYLLILFFFLAISVSATAQDYQKHTVQQGETVISISKKYKITPYEIYRLNPDAKNGINQGAVLLLPKPGSTPAVIPPKGQPTKVANIIHEVQQKETLYGISKKYEITVEALEEANKEILKEGLKAGQELIIPIKGSGVAAQIDIAEKKEEKKKEDPYIYHTVLQGETKYSIARDYNLTLQLLEELNPEVKEVLPLGYRLKLVKNSAITEDIHGTPQQEYVRYVVKPKETFYSLSKATGVSEEKIAEMNPETKDGLKEGMTLIFPAGTRFSTQSMLPEKASLLKSLNTSEEKELAILLPFNIDKLDTDTIRGQMLRTDRLLNITLDFYAGALMAIDSAAVLGLPLKVKIVDATEAKSGGDNTLIASLVNTDAVIGPFFQSNAEYVASKLATRNVPVISPLSKETGKSYPNLYQSVPSDDRVKKAMLEYLRSKRANVLALVDPKKVSSRQFIQQNYPGMRFGALNADGTVTAASLRAMMVKDSMNYVLLETDRIGSILSVTRALTELQKDYNIQLAVLDRNDAYEYEEAPLERLSALKMLYPSVYKNNSSGEAAAFEKAFKQKNNIMPNQFAMRGFDVTFDTILRLFQTVPLPQVMATAASEQAGNKFAYVTENGGNYNKAVYILQYDENFTIKTAQ